MPVIQARFKSTCPKCSNPIEVGARVAWEPGSKAVHETCPAAPPRPPVEKPPLLLTMEVLSGRPVAAFEALLAPEAAPPPVLPPVRTSVLQARPEAKQHVVGLCTKYGQRPPLAAPAPGYAELVLGVDAVGKVTERLLVRRGDEVWYVRFNGGPQDDRTVNNFADGLEIAWRVAWSPTVQMALAALEALPK